MMHRIPSIIKCRVRSVRRTHIRKIIARILWTRWSCFFNSYKIYTRISKTRCCLCARSIVKYSPRIPRYREKCPEEKKYEDDKFTHNYSELLLDRTFIRSHFAIIRMIVEWYLKIWKIFYISLFIDTHSFHAFPVIIRFPRNICFISWKYRIAINIWRV
jgi:hypothetical protein